MGKFGDDRLSWEEYARLVIGMTVDELSKHVAKGYVDPVYDRTGFDIPPEFADVVSHRHRIFMSVECTDMVRKNLSIEVLHQATSKVRRHMDAYYPSTDPYSKGIWAVYGPKFDAVENAYMSGSLEATRRAVDALIDLRLHD